MATNFMGKMGEISLFTFIRRLGIPKRSGISQVWLKLVHLRWCGYIRYKT